MLLMSSSTDPDNHPAETSRWPLPASGQRTVVPPAVLATMTAHPLCRGCLPHGVGYYPHASGHRMYRANPADDLLIYCVSGQGQLQVEGQSLRFTASDDGRVTVTPWPCATAEVLLHARGRLMPAAAYGSNAELAAAGSREIQLTWRLAPGEGGDAGSGG